MHNGYRQLQGKHLPRFNVNQKGRLEETDLNEIVRKVQSVLPLLLRSNGAIAVNIMLSKKDLKILADSALMVDALLSLVRNALHALPDAEVLSLSTTRVDFTNQSILDGSTCTYGACASITVAGTSRDIDERWLGCKSPQPARKTGNGKDSELATAYRTIKQHHGSMKTERVPGHGTTITVYLPLARLDDTADWSAPDVA